MSTEANKLASLLVSACFLAATGPISAEQFFPLHVDQVWEYVRHDANDAVGWPVELQVTDRTTLDLLEYFGVQSWNYDNDSQFADVGYVRSTEQALYAYNPAGEDYVQFQKGPVGTKWSEPEVDDTYNYRVREVVAIEPVTVPYGTFSLAYKFRSYQCVDPDNLGLGKSPDYYSWIVPGVGFVKEEDYWCDYPPAIEELAGMFIAPVYRFWSDSKSRHFYTITESEKNKLVNTYSHVWAYEGIVYYGCSDDSDPAASPVYRFWSDRYEGHFYTISESEKDKLATTYSHVWTYEGPAFYAYAEGQQPAGTSPVYRFWSDALGGHFYTMSESERDKLINQYAHVWSYEGVAWHAYE